MSWEGSDSKTILGVVHGSLLPTEGMSTPCKRCSHAPALYSFTFNTAIWNVDESPWPRFSEVEITQVTFLNFILYPTLFLLKANSKKALPLRNKHERLRTGSISTNHREMANLQSNIVANGHDALHTHSSPPLTGPQQRFTCHASNPPCLMTSDSSLTSRSLVPTDNSHMHRDVVKSGVLVFGVNVIRRHCGCCGAVEGEG